MTETLEPWFRSRRETNRLLKQQGVFHLRKWRVYYERWGCLGCHTKERLHGGHGFCEPCLQRVTARLSTVIKEMADNA
jgi:hypothetical protein